MCTNTPRPLVVTVDFDDTVEDPCELDGWRLYSFSTRHTNFKDPVELGLSKRGSPDPKLRRKLKDGTAHLLSYYKHSGSLWSFQGHGPQCQWDTVQLAGLLVWEEDEYAPPANKRREDAQAFLDVYNDWINGNCYWYAVHDAEGESLSCGGFLGEAALREAVTEALDGRTDYTLKGDAAFIMK